MPSAKFNDYNTIYNNRWHALELRVHKMSNPVSDPTHKTNTISHWLEEVAFNRDGLIPAIAHDKQTGDILMMAWMNAESLQQTVQTKTAVYYSRSRNKLWHKGETSGHTQLVHDIFLDCDADVIVLSVTQIGGIACHTGRKSCFFRRLDISDSTSPNWEVVAPVLKDPKDIYSPTENTASDNVKTAHIDDISNDVGKNKVLDAQNLLRQLDAVLSERKQAVADSSYVASLYARGINKILEKVGEESVEAILAAKDLANAAQGSNQTTDATLVNDLVYEIADLWFHTLVTLAWFNLDSNMILTELARRFGLSGIEEKNSRLA